MISLLVVSIIIGFVPYCICNFTLSLCQGTGAGGWEESDEEDVSLYTRYQGPSPGSLLSDKLSNLTNPFGRKKRLGQEDLMQMTENLGRI